MENKKCSKPPTRLECLRISANVLSNQINEQSLLLIGHIISRLLFRIFGNSAQAGNINTATASTICYFGTCPCRAKTKCDFFRKHVLGGFCPTFPKMGTPKPSKTIGSPNKTTTECGGFGDPMGSLCFWKDQNPPHCCYKMILSHYHELLYQPITILQHHDINGYRFWNPLPTMMILSQVSPLFTIWTTLNHPLSTHHQPILKSTHYYQHIIIKTWLSTHTSLVGGWPTPLKNHGVRQLRSWHSQVNAKS